MIVVSKEQYTPQKSKTVNNNVLTAVHEFNVSDYWFTVCKGSDDVYSFDVTHYNTSEYTLNGDITIDVE